MQLKNHWIISLCRSRWLKKNPQRSERKKERYTFEFPQCKSFRNELYVTYTKSSVRSNRQTRKRIHHMNETNKMLDHTMRRNSLAGRYTNVRGPIDRYKINDNDLWCDTDRTTTEKSLKIFPPLYLFLARLFKYLNFSHHPETKISNFSFFHENEPPPT